MWNCRRHARRASDIRRDPRRADQSAVILQVGLDDIDAPLGDHPAETLWLNSPPAAGDGNRQGVCHLFRVFQVVEGAGLFEVHRPDVFEHPAHPNRLGRVIGTVRVGMEVDLIPASFERGKRAARAAEPRRRCGSCPPTRYLTAFAPVWSMSFCKYSTSSCGRRVAIPAGDVKRHVARITVPRSSPIGRPAGGRAGRAA